MYFQILADAMGLGKTVMMISVIISNPGRGGMPTDPSVSGPPDVLQVSGSQVGKPSQMETKKKQSGPRKGGGTLIVCPMTLLGQWKVAVTFTFKFSFTSFRHQSNMPHIEVHFSILFMHLEPS